MKKFYLFFLLFIYSVLSFAQADCDSTYKDLTQKAFKNLDKSLITSNILYEYVMPFADLTEFNQLSDTTTALHLMQAYQEMYEASFNTTGLVHPLDLNLNLDSFHPDPEFHHPVGILDFNFHSIDSNAVNHNLLYVNHDEFYDVPGRNSSPYLKHTVFLATPLLTESFDDFTGGSTHYLHFDDAFVLSNTGFNLSMVNHLEILLNGSVVYTSAVNGLHNFTANITIPNTNTENTLQIKLGLSSILLGRTALKVISKFLSKKKILPNPCDGTYSFEVEGYPFGLPYGPPATKNQTGIATVYYANANCASGKITKPIIFIDGFDPFNKHDHKYIWNEYLNKEYDPNVRLGDQLRIAGYDVIILDQKKTASFNSGGGAFIERNGLVLAKLLTTLYDNHSNTLQDDFVVVGASMGGLVARYGLSWMESQNLPHHTRLFVSFDSPQNGAYIPLGMQLMLDNFLKNGLLSWFNGASNALHNTAAAKQMLLLHSSTLDNQTGIARPHPYRQIFLDNLASVGNWPTQCRIVAINNGNRVGLLKNQGNPTGPEFKIQPSEKILDFGIKRWLTAWCNDDLCYKLRLKVWSQPENGNQTVHTFFQLTTNPLLNLLSFTPIYKSQTFKSRGLNSQSLDIAPGSRIGTDYLDAINIKIKAGIGLIGMYQANINKSMNTNFIPITSSTAYTFPNNEPVNYYKDFTGIVLSKCAGTTPFDTVYAPTYDMNHVGIDAFIAASFKDEVYNHKPESSCGSTPCPQHYVSSTTVQNNLEYNASRSIILMPGFQVAVGKIFKATVGYCGSANQQNIDDPAFGKQSNLYTPECSFEWDMSKFSSQCGAAHTTLEVFVRHIPMDSYPEFSLDNFTWVKGSIGSQGHTFNLSGNNQMVYARLKDQPASALSYHFLGCTPIHFNDTDRTKLCNNGLLTQTVYIDGLPANATAQFSIDGGNTWQNANVGSRGFAYTHSLTQNYQQFMARSSSHPNATISSYFHSSCSNLQNMDWGPYNVSTYDTNVCKYEVSVTGLAADSYAEFSIDDGVNWYKAQVGNSGHVFLLPWGAVPYQDFWYRPAELTDIKVWGNLPMCEN